jgi:hypothetical protein
MLEGKKCNRIAYIISEVAETCLLQNVPKMKEKLMRWAECKKYLRM